MASNVEYTIQIPGVYDGWSIAVIRHPQYLYVNRWASDDDPLVAAPGYERRFDLTEEYITRSTVARGLLKDVVWR